MHAIQKSKSHKGKCTPNVLPCRVHHNGPVNASKRYWEPRTTSSKKASILPLPCTLTYPLICSDGKTIAYFRGRKLHGKQFKVPQGYRGIVLASTDRILPKESQSSPAEEDEDAEHEADVKVLEEQAEFDGIIVWGHEVVPDETADPYVRGMEEWLSFAEQVCTSGCFGGIANHGRFMTRVKRRKMLRMGRNNSSLSGWRYEEWRYLGDGSIYIGVGNGTGYPNTIIWSFLLKSLLASWFGF